MSKKRPLPRVSYYRDADGNITRNHRQHRRHKAYRRYLEQTADIAKIDGKIVACQSQGFVSWLWDNGPTVPFTGDTYTIARAEFRYSKVPEFVAGDEAADISWTKAATAQLAEINKRFNSEPYETVVSRMRSEKMDRIRKEFDALDDDIDAKIAIRQGLHLSEEAENQVMHYLGVKDDYDAWLEPVEPMEGDEA